MGLTYSERFFSMLQWAVERKDFEDFWPVGLESTGPRYWSKLVLDLEDKLSSNGELTSPDFPTANVALAFCLIYGMRELGWNYERCLQLYEAVFSAAQKVKDGDLFNPDGHNIIWNNETLTNAYQSAKEVSNSLCKDLNVLSGQVLALAESEFFMNHRIATERHGPYNFDDDSIIIVRSVKNLWPTDLWPELSNSVTGSPEFHILFRYKKAEIKFDILSNLISELPSEDTLLEIKILDESNIWNKEYVDTMSSIVCDWIMEIRSVLRQMTRQEKSERMTEILYYGCKDNFTSWKDNAHQAILLGQNRTIINPVPSEPKSRLTYYDLTKTFTP